LKKLGEAKSLEDIEIDFLQKVPKYGAFCKISLLE
jgi:hypothetical protein